MDHWKRAVRSPIALMALTIFIDFTGFGLIIPLLPFWAERLGAGPREIGLLLAAYALAQVLFTPMLGALSDRFGRRPVILASLLVEAASFALTALAGSLWLLFAARLVGGMGASNIGSAQAVVADVSSRAERARAMGAIGAAIGLGFVVGPALGGALVALGQPVPFWAAMGVALVNAALVWRFLPETRHGARASVSASATIMQPTTMQPALERPYSQLRDVLLAGWGRALRRPGVARLVAINLLYTVAFTGMEAVFVLLTQHTFGWTAQQNGYLFAYIGVVVVVIQGVVVGLLVKRLGERWLLVIGLLLLAGGLILLPWSGTLATLLGALGLVAVGDGAVTPALSALLSLVSPADAQGETLGVAQGLVGFGRLVGPLVAGSLFAAGESLPFVFGGALVLIGTLLTVPVLPVAPATPATPSARSRGRVPARADARSVQSSATGAPWSPETAVSDAREAAGASR